MKEFFGIGGYTREPEGYMSAEHLIFVTTLVIAMIALAVVLGLRYREKDHNAKSHVLLVAAILIDGIELFKIVVICIRNQDPLNWLYMLPLFLCSIQLITIPLAALSRGRLQEVALDFVLIFGILGAILGTYGAGQNYGSYPVISIDNVASGITHCISGFSSLFIAISGMASMKRRNIPASFGILAAFCVAAYTVNRLIDYNYMFLMAGDGTPYDIFYNLVGGNAILYPLTVVALFLMYITAFYFAYYFATEHRRVRAARRAPEVAQHKA